MINKIFSGICVFIFLTGCNDGSKNEKTKPPKAIKILQSPATDSCGEPYLVTDKNGLVYLSWIEKKGNAYQLRFSTFHDNGWTKAVSIAEGVNWFVNWADYPVIASNGNNHLMAMFLEKSDSGAYTYDVRYVISADLGKTWTKPKLLNEDGKKAEHGFLSVVPYDEKYFVSWLDGRNTAEISSSGHEGHHGQMSLRAALIDKYGQKEKEWELDNRVCDCCQTSISMGKEGPIIIYRDRSDAEIRDMSLVRMVNGEWSKLALIYADNWKIEGCPVNGPRAEAIDNNLGVAWFTVENGIGVVKFAFSNNGGQSFKAPVKVSESKALGRVDMVLLDSATAMVSWMEGSTIKLAKVHDDGTRDATIIVAQSSEARSSGFPQIAKSGSELFIAWTDNKTKSIKIASIGLN
ncbi:sialidase family protein [Flavitalea sp.]|nr:sialidase family protein [Flavitalea sp.]